MLNLCGRSPVAAIDARWWLLIDRRLQPSSISTSPSGELKPCPILKFQKIPCLPTLRPSEYAALIHTLVASWPQDGWSVANNGDIVVTL
jgi:hypothetical protein